MLVRARGGITRTERITVFCFGGILENFCFGEIVQVTTGEVIIAKINICQRVGSGPQTLHEEWSQ